MKVPVPSTGVAHYTLLPLGLTASEREGQGRAGCAQGFVVCRQGCDRICGAGRSGARARSSNREKARDRVRAGRKLEPDEEQHRERPSLYPRRQA